MILAEILTAEGTLEWEYNFFAAVVTLQVSINFYTYLVFQLNIK